MEFKNVKKKIYIHLMDGAPAYYDPERRRLYFCGRTIKVRKFPSNLEQMKGERAIHQKSIRALGIEELRKLSHLVIYI